MGHAEFGGGGAWEPYILAKNKNKISNYVRKIVFDVPE